MTKTAGTSHLSRDLLFGYINNELDPGDLAPVERHLKGCEFCSDALEGLMNTDLLLAGEEINNINNKIDVLSGQKATRTIPVWFKPMAAAAAILVFSFLAWLSYDFVSNNREGNQTISQNATKTEKHSTSNREDINKNLSNNNNSGATEDIPGTTLVESEESDMEEAIPGTEPLMIPTEIEEMEVPEDKDIVLQIKEEDQSLFEFHNEAATPAAEIGTSFDDEADMLSSSINGRVIDKESGEPIPFATVRLNPGNLGTSTDFDGNFVLESEPGNYTLDVSYVGYSEISKNLNVDEKGTQKLSIEMTQDQLALDEVVIQTESGKRNKAVSKSESVTLKNNDLFSAEEVTDEYSLGMEAYEKGQYRKASKYFEDLATESTNYINSRYLLGHCEYEKGNPSAALTLFNQYLQSGSKSYYQDARWYKSMSLIETGRVTEARYELQQIVKDKGPYKARALEKLDTLKD